MKTAYEDWSPGQDALATLRRADQLGGEYADAGYDLTLRQLYYQFVQRGWLPNTDRSYKNLGNIINKGRLAGYLDWNHLIDRTRNLRSLPHWVDPADGIRAIQQQYRNDLWTRQPVRVEVWVEKEALAGVVQRAAARLDCAWFACRGYVSQSEMWGAAQRLRGYIEAGQRVVMLHLGDHDPSGIDMTRDIIARLSQFIYSDLGERLGFGPENAIGEDEWYDIQKQIEEEYFDGEEHDLLSDPLTVERIALNMDQIRQYGPPPNPTKITDSRARGYIDRFGDSSWELDALDPATLDALITSWINTYLDEDRYQLARDVQEAAREQLTAVSQRWDEVTAYLND